MYTIMRAPNPNGIGPHMMVYTSSSGAAQGRDLGRPGEMMCTPSYEHHNPGHQTIPTRINLINLINLIKVIKLIRIGMV